MSSNIKFPPYQYILNAHHTVKLLQLVNDHLWSINWWGHAYIYGLTTFNRPLYRYNSIQSPWQRSTGTAIKFSLLVGGLMPTCDFFEIFSWLGSTSIYTHHQFHSIMFTGLQIQQWRVILNIKIKTIGFLWDIKNLSYALN